MKPETKMSRILLSNDPVNLKILKLQNLCLRCYPASPIQDEVRNAYRKLQVKS
jgi:hypothetical protein